jgi:hypothetical protein
MKSQLDCSPTEVAQPHHRRKKWANSYSDHDVTMRSRSSGDTRSLSVVTLRESAR